MEARYDSEARSVAIGLAEDAHHSRTDEVALNTIVGVRDGQAVMVEVILIDDVGLAGLDAAAESYGLDGEWLHAAANAAMEAPDSDGELAENHDEGPA